MSLLYKIGPLPDGLIMDDATEKLFRQRLAERAPYSATLSRRERKMLKQPTQTVAPQNIFTWHLNQFTLFEDETDPAYIKQGVRYRRVGVTEGGRLIDTEISAQEDRLGWRIPAPWRDVYLHFNGGWVHTLFWGDSETPRLDDIEPIPQTSHEYLALQDVAPLKVLLPAQMDGLDCSKLDPRLIALACAKGQAVLLDFRDGGEPRICLAYFSSFSNDPLAGWETDEFTHWWPDMRVFFRGLYLQDRII
jgi:hypothetical protein